MIREVDMKSKNLYRSNQQKMIAGVMGGIAEHFGWNVTILRIVFILVSIFSAGFPGILIYLILWFLIPEQDPTQDLPSPAYQSQPIRTIYEEQSDKRDGPL